MILNVDELRKTEREGFEPSGPAAGDAPSTASSESEDTSMATPSCSIGCGPVGPEGQKKSDDGENGKWSRQIGRAHV